MVNIMVDVVGDFKEKLNGREYGLQLNEATDINNGYHLILFVRLIDNNSVVEDLLFYKSITTTANAEDLFDSVATFLSDIDIVGTKVIGFFIDSTGSLSGCYKGLHALMRNPEALWSHYVIHTEALVWKYLSRTLNQVLEHVVNVINFTKTQPSQAIFFNKFCEEM